MDELERNAEAAAAVKAVKKKKKRRRRRRQMSVGKMIVLDLLAIVVGLNVFALFHHVLDYWGVSLGGPAMEPVVVATLPTAPAESAVPAEAPQESENDPGPTPEPTPARVYSGVWGEKFADKFTEGEVIQTENSYQSENVNVAIERVEKPGLIYYVADVYVSDLKYFGSAFAGGEGAGDYGSGLALISDMSKRVNAVAAICGDHYYGRREGMVVRNGVIFRDARNEDVCVLYTDGRMVTLTDEELDIEQVKAASPWQVWSFGPGLLDAEGHAKTFADNQKNALSVNPQNPRSAIGYYEPGHYCLVEIEGNRWGCFIGSYGLTLSEMATLFEELGCQSAYNLDGGRSAAISWMGERLSVDYSRTISDIIYVTDTPIEREG